MFLNWIHDFVWGIPALVGILGVGLWLTLRTGFIQLRLFPRAVKNLFRQPASDGFSPFRALCTALAATVGTGNLIGVAGAICLGGPGAVFWMWVSGFLGMATKFAEATLAVAFRTQEGGEYLGGPMYILSRAMGKKWYPLAAAYSLLGLLASFGVGNATQINAVITGFHGVLNSFGASNSLGQDVGLGLLLAVAVGAVLLGGSKRIGAVAEVLIPLLSAGYVLLCIVVLLMRREFLLGALASIVSGAFSPRAVTGGVIGSAAIALRVGCARGVFTNEAGMGTASMAHACAQTANPTDQGAMGILEVFIDTIVICTMTALVILVSGILIPYGTEKPELTNLAFTRLLGPWVSVFLAAALGCFAFATVLGWGLYGGRCARFLFGARSIPLYTAIQILMVVLGAGADTKSLWCLAETLNGLMAIPNLIMLVFMTPRLVRLIETEKRRLTGIR